MCSLTVMNTMHCCNLRQLHHVFTCHSKSELKQRYLKILLIAMHQHVVCALAFGGGQAPATAIHQTCGKKAGVQLLWPPAVEQ